MPTTHRSAGADRPNPTIPSFELGQLVATPAALAVLRDGGVSALEIMSRHAALDTGALEAADVRANVDALASGARLISAYTVNNNGEDVRLLVITEAVCPDGHRASTCLLRSDEY